MQLVNCQIMINSSRRMRLKLGANAQDTSLGNIMEGVRYNMKSDEIRFVRWVEIIRFVSPFPHTWNRALPKVILQ